MLEQRQTQTLEAMQCIVAPLVRWLLHEGVGYQQLVAALKPVFIEQAHLQAQAQGEKDTDSALSLRSGVHRKDISAWRRTEHPISKAPKRSVPAEVFTRWISDPLYMTAAGPRRLPRHGMAPSFEALAVQVSKDVHPLTVLNELLRLGLVSLAVDASGEDEVVLSAAAFIPEGDREQLLALFIDNLYAHLDTAVHNLSGSQPRQLEQAAYAGGLTTASAQALAALSRRLWGEMLQGFLLEAQRLYAQDEGKGLHVVRLGAYFHDQSFPATDDHQSVAAAKEQA